MFLLQHKFYNAKFKKRFFIEKIELHAHLNERT